MGLQQNRVGEYHILCGGQLHRKHHCEYWAGAIRRKGKCAGHYEFVKIAGRQLLQDHIGSVVHELLEWFCKRHYRPLKELSKWGDDQSVLHFLLHSARKHRSLSLKWSKRSTSSTMPLNHNRPASNQTFDAGLLLCIYISTKV